MPPNEPVRILIVNEHAEEVKLVTVSLRGFFPDCRIDAAYSAEEASSLSAAAESGWAVVLIDDACLAATPATFIEDVKRRSPYAAVLLQSTRTDAASALQALQNGADYFLSKHSPAFLTELLFCMREAIAKGDLQRTADRMEIRHRQLLDSLGDVYYELDAKGNFLDVSPNVLSLLGCRAEDVIGRPYHILFSPADEPIARFRFNERRSGTRATTGLKLTFQGKRRPEGTIIPVTLEISARGLYDPSQRFLGTIGIIAQLSERKRQEGATQELLQQHERAETLRGITGQAAGLSVELQQPLSTLLNECRLLFKTLHDGRVLDRLQSLTGYASAAAELGTRLENLVHEISRTDIPATLNHLLEEALRSTTPEQGHQAAIVTEFASTLPAYHGDRTQTVRLFQLLFTYARTYLQAVGRPRLLVVRTRPAGEPAFVDAPTLFPLTPSHTVEIEIDEADRERPANTPVSEVSEPIDLSELYRLARGLNASLDVSAPASGPLRLMLRFSSVGPQPAELSQAPAAVTVPPPLSAAPSPPPLPQETPPPSPRSVTTERRAQPRVTTTFPAQVNTGSFAWNGTLINLSLSGACILLPNDFPSIALQEAYILVRTAAGILELTGLVYERKVPTASGSTDPEQSHLVMRLHALPHTETAVLASLIEAAQERSLDFSLEVLLAAGALGAQASGAKQLPVDFTDHDRRETLRVPVTLPVRLETSNHREPANRLAAQMVNLSRQGASLLVKGRPEQVRGSVVLHFAPAHRSDQPGSHEPGAPDTVLPGQVTWSIASQAGPGALPSFDASPAARVGVRFHQLTPFAEREVNRVVRQHMITQWTSQALSTSSSIVSVPRECRNARGQAISIVDDHLRRTVEADTPTVVLAPGFGQTASDYAALSYYLAAHHLRVLRYDHTNHVGCSEGELQHATLRSVQHDLSKVVEFVRHTWPQTPILVIASDLAARAALKMAAQTRPLNLLLLVNPLLDIEATLMMAHGHDLVADYRFGLRRGIGNLMGLNVNIDQFVGDLIAGHCTDLGSTLDDLRLLRSPLSIVTSPAPLSATFPPADLPHAFLTALGGKTRLVNIPTPLTDQSLSAQERHPPAFKLILEQIASVLPLQPGTFDHEIPIHRQLAEERRIEQEYTGLRHNVSQITREALCAAHLSHLPQLGNLHEYRKLLDDLYGFMSPLEPGAVLADAGMGQSDLTRAALVNHTYRTGQASWTGKKSPLIVGLGRSGETIGQARQAVHSLQRELSTGFVGRLMAMPPLTVGWIQADWTTTLPFKTSSLSRLVCNLSLSYVPSPVTALQAWYRVLQPEGRLILTTFHPNTDLSTLYRRHLRQANQDEFSPQAQPLLHYFGRLREAIRHRLIHTFDQAELSALLTQAGMTPFQVLPVLDGQAFVAIVGKRNSSSSNP